MKTLNETFTDKEFKVMLKVKGNCNWHDFLMEVINKYVAPTKEELIKEDLKDEWIESGGQAMGCN